MDIDTVAPDVLPFPGLYKDLLFGTRWRSNGKHSAYVILTRGEYIHTLHLEECICESDRTCSSLLDVEHHSGPDRRACLVTLRTFLLAHDADIFWVQVST